MLANAFLAIVAICLAIVDFTNSQQQPAHHADEVHDWHTFKAKFGRKHKDHAEEQHRKSRFEHHLAIIKKHNAEGHKHPFQLGINHLSDLTEHEYNARMGLKPEFVKADITRRKREAQLRLLKRRGLADSGNSSTTGTRSRRAVSCPIPVPTISYTYDWRPKCGTTVRDQGNCGSCWAFASIDALECHLKIKRGTTVSLSQQNLMDCSWSQGNAGCNGGLMSQAFQYVYSAAGVNSIQDYPYTATESKVCNVKPTKYAKVDWAPSCDVAYNSEKDLLASLSHGPVTVGICASCPTFQNYKSGVYRDPSCTCGPNHAVVVVGHIYDTTTKLWAWVVKNSWGVGWGEKGYIRIASGGNPLGIASIGCFPNIL